MGSTIPHQRQPIQRLPSSQMWEVSTDRCSYSFPHPLEHNARCNHFDLEVACCWQKVPHIMRNNGRSPTIHRCLQHQLVRGISQLWPPHKVNIDGLRSTREG